MNRSRWLTLAGALLICSVGFFAVECFPAASVLRPAIQAEQPAPQRGPAQAPAIRLLAATFVPDADMPEAQAPSDGGAQSRAQYLVQFQGPILDAWRTELESSGAEILDYIPDYAYKVALGRASLRQLQRVSGVVWVGPFLSDYRASPQLAATGRQIVRVEMDGDQVDGLLAALPSLGATLIGQDGQAVVLEIDAARLTDLGRIEGVRWISPLQVPRSSVDVAASEIRAVRAWELGYQGDGQVINITDSGLDTGVDYPQIAGDMHLDLDNRVSHLRSWPISGQYDGLLNNPGANDGAADLDSGHGTHVAGAAVGNGARSGGRYRGLAPRSSLTLQAVEQYCDFNALGVAQGFEDGYWILGIPADLGALYGEAYSWGARVHNNSWNVGEEGSYTVESQQTDRFVWEHRDMVVVFAVGNEGQDANRDGIIDPMSVLAPATAKNVIAVGATENRRPALSPPSPYQNYGQFSGLTGDPFRSDPLGDAGIDGLAAFGGRGPTEDGRLVPHVVAPGTWIVSTRSSRAQGRGWPSNTSVDSDPYYVYMGGTSSSAPLVTGAASLVRQSYQSRGHTPSAALVKATLIQSATDIPGQYGGPFVEAGPIPNHGEGWGAINVERAIAPAGRHIDQTTALRTSEAATYTYSGRSSSGPVKVTLVWTDYPAALEAAVQLVNDLDLEVTAPDGTLYRGNVFAGGRSATGGSADRLNNVECVYLPSAQAGDYRVTVRGHNVPQGPQNFALLVTMPFASYARRSLLPLVLRNTTQVLPTPRPTEELIYDDGTCEGYHNLHAAAVRFAVTRHRQVVQLRYFLKGTAKPVRLLVYDASWGVLYSALVTPRSVDSSQYSWFSHDIAGGVDVGPGEFWVAIAWPSEGAEPHLGEDTDPPYASRSYGNWENPDPPFGLLDNPPMDLMIRAVVSEPTLTPPTATPTVQPTSTPTPTVQPTSTPTPTLAPEEFRDDFSAISGRWLITATADYDMGYVDGVYRIRVSPSKRRVGSLVGLDRPGDRLLEVDGRAMNDISQAYGLIVSSDTSTRSSCAFLVSPTGHFALVCWQDSEEATLVNWTPSDAIVLGNGWNRLSVRRVGQGIECQINGTGVLTHADARLSASRFGLVSFCFGAAQSDARFDNFRMLPLGGSGWSGVPALAEVAEGPAGAAGRTLAAPPAH